MRLPLLMAVLLLGPAWIVPTGLPPHPVDFAWTPDALDERRHDCEGHHTAGDREGRRGAAAARSCAPDRRTSPGERRSIPR
ncbi:predicted protein [Streptomyces viridosporus ATCC 14672]|uniref:Predicted protein n=1 Tax=Streptomyces viridosporus (strain ATCC 14672 / DSM 40746 / JCM 4963 / KCTC 9882 / NRRL B-12104 / FH 1290) TaxID=566461 RepID=D6A168_STRV1|nr:predicted protein [Streptomyces viridosporus ATCC 14672]